VSVSLAFTTVAVTPSSPSIIVNQPLQVTVTPTPVSGLPLPTGSATLSYNGINAPAQNLVNGSATFTIPANSLQRGTNNLMGSYSGDVYYNQEDGNGSVAVKSSGTIAPTVLITAPTTTVLTFLFSVTVTVSGPNGDPVPTGSISLVTVGYIYVAPLVNGSAIFSIQNQLPGGPNALTANYLGDPNYTAGSGTASVNIIAWPGITFTPYYPTIPVNLPFTMTVAVVSYNPAIATPTGTVTLASGTYTSSPVQLNAGSASFTIPANSLPIGSDDLTASYSGDLNFSAGSSDEFVTVTPAVPPGITISGTTATVMRGATTGNTSTITVTPAGGFTGSVALSASITTSPSGIQNPPTLSFGATSPMSITGSAAGTATLTATTSAESGCTAQAYPMHRGVPWYTSGGAALACLLLFGIRARRRRWLTMLGLLALLVAFSGGTLACGGGGGGSTCDTAENPGTLTGTYTVTVTGTSGTTTGQGTITLIVE